MTSSIAWIDGQWGTAASLKLPLDDRALLLADGLFETVLVRNGQPQLLQEHLQRSAHGCAALLRRTARVWCGDSRPLGGLMGARLWAAQGWRPAVG